MAHESYSKFACVLRKVMNVFGSNRILFGTDAPSFSFLYPESEWGNIIRDLPNKAPEGIKFIPAEIEAVLHDNAARVLKLT